MFMKNTLRNPFTLKERKQIFVVILITHSKSFVLGGGSMAYRTLSHKVKVKASYLKKNLDLCC